MLCTHFVYILLNDSVRRGVCETGLARGLGCDTLSSINSYVTSSHSYSQGNLYLYRNLSVFQSILTRAVKFSHFRIIYLIKESPTHYSQFPTNSTSWKLSVHYVTLCTCNCFQIQVKPWYWAPPSNSSSFPCQHFEFIESLQSRLVSPEYQRSLLVTSQILRLLVCRSLLPFWHFSSPCSWFNPSSIKCL